MTHQHSGYVRSLAERARAASLAIASLDDAGRAGLLSAMADAVNHSSALDTSGPGVPNRYVTRRPDLLTEESDRW